MNEAKMIDSKLWAQSAVYTFRRPVNWLRGLWINRHVPSAKKQIEELGNFIMNEVPGEPSQNQGAVETAIRLLRNHVREPRNRSTI